jgi:very-short-patch-repair endonuclease
MRKKNIGCLGRKFTWSREHIEKIRIKNKGKIRTPEQIRVNSESHIGKHHDEKTKKKISEKLKGKNNGMFGKKHTEEWLENHKKRMINGQAIHMNKCKPIEERERSRQRMLNGEAARIQKFIKNPSNEEVLLRNIVKKLYPDCEFQHQVFNYSLDVALLEFKIAIEYDGHYHFHTEEARKYFKNRQTRIENEGWKFIRYTIFDKFPSKEQVEYDIKKIIEGIN